MRLLLIFTFFILGLNGFGQDTSQVDTAGATSIPAIMDSAVRESPTSTIPEVEKRKKRKQVSRQEKVKLVTAENEKEIEPIPETSNKNVNSISWLLIFGVVIGLVIIGVTFVGKLGNVSESVADEELVPDYIKRKLLSRREYYREVYLKSAAWQRKRYLVLKRDQWRCVYCGGQATEVHHTRYAKINIGKEPIEWLVSVCRPCHDSKHK